MNKSRLFIILITVIGLASSPGCGKPQTDARESQTKNAIETDLDIVIPDSTAEPTP